MKTLRNEEGQTLVLTALSMMILLAFMALAIDVGLLFRAKRNLQIAADAAVISAALTYQHPTAGVTPGQAAINAAAANRVTDPTNVLLHNPATGGYHVGPGYLEVIIRQPNPTFFMNIFTGRSTLDVAARAVAGVVPNPACIYLLNPDDPGALSVKGNYRINAKDCGIIVDSSSTKAICATGNGNNGEINALYLDVVGDQPANGNCGGTISGTTVTSGVSPQSDPLGNLAGPDPTQAGVCSVTSSVKAITSDTTILEGTTTVADATGTVCFTNPVQISNTITLPAKMYVFEQGVEIMQNANVTVTEGTFDLYGGDLKANGGPSCAHGDKVSLLQDSQSYLKITAPTGDKTYAYEGIAIFQPFDNHNLLEVQFGSNSANYGAGQLDGLIYAPGAPVELHDNGGNASATGLIASTLSVCSSTLKITNYSSNTPDSPLNKVTLVE